MAKIRTIYVCQQCGYEAHKSVSYTHLRAHETPEHLVCRLLLEKQNVSALIANGLALFVITLVVNMAAWCVVARRSEYSGANCHCRPRAVHLRSPPVDAGAAGPGRRPPQAHRH